MAEERINEQSTVDVEDNSATYIEAIEQLKANTVSKESYDKLKAENKQLLDSLINGQQIELPKQKEQVDVAAIRKDLFNTESSLTNLQYAEKAIQLREALMEAGEPDPFLPVGKRISPTAEDEAAAEKVAEAFKSCIEYAEGDSEIFTNELMRITKDVKINRRK